MSPEFKLRAICAAISTLLLPFCNFQLHSQETCPQTVPITSHFVGAPYAEASIKVEHTDGTSSFDHLAPLEMTTDILFNLKSGTHTISIESIERYTADSLTVTATPTGAQTITNTKNRFVGIERQTATLELNLPAVTTEGKYGSETLTHETTTSIFEIPDDFSNQDSIDITANTVSIKPRFTSNEYIKKYTIDIQPFGCTGCPLENVHNDEHLSRLLMIDNTTAATTSTPASNFYGEREGTQDYFHYDKATSNAVNNSHPHAFDGDIRFKVTNVTISDPAATTDNPTAIYAFDSNNLEEYTLSERPGGLWGAVSIDMKDLPTGEYVNSSELIRINVDGPAHTAAATYMNWEEDTSEDPPSHVNAKNVGPNLWLTPDYDAMYFYSDDNNRGPSYLKDPIGFSPDYEGFWSIIGDAKGVTKGDYVLSGYTESCLNQNDIRHVVLYTPYEPKQNSWTVGNVASNDHLQCEDCGENADLSDTADDHNWPSSSDHTISSWYEGDTDDADVDSIATKTSYINDNCWSRTQWRGNYDPFYEEHDPARFWKCGHGCASDNPIIGALKTFKMAKSTAIANQSSWAEYEFIKLAYPCPKWNAKGTIDINADGDVGPTIDTQATYDAGNAASFSTTTTLPTGFTNTALNDDSGWMIDEVYFTLVHHSKKYELSQEDNGIVDAFNFKLSSNDGNTIKQVNFDCIVSSIDNENYTIHASNLSALNSDFTGTSIVGTSWTGTIEGIDNGTENLPIIEITDFKLKLRRDINQGPCTTYDQNWTLIPGEFDNEHWITTECEGANDEEYLLPDFTNASSTNDSIQITIPQRLDVAENRGIHIQTITEDLFAVFDPIQDQSYLAFKTLYSTAAATARNDFFFLQENETPNSDPDKLRISTRHAHFSDDNLSNGVQPNIIVVQENAGAVYNLDYEVGTLGDGFWQDNNQPGDVSILYANTSNVINEHATTLYNGCGEDNNTFDSYLLVETHQSLPHSNNESEYEIHVQTNSNSSTKESDPFNLPWEVYYDEDLVKTHLTEIMSGADLDRNKLGLTSEAAAHLQAFDITDSVHNDSARLYTEYISGDFLRISIPLNHPSLSDITEPDQIEDSLVTYWGIPNGSDRWGQLCVILRNVNDDSQTEYFFDSDSIPLLLRDLPYLSMDKFLIDIDLNHININGKAGDVFEVGVAASLVTRGRHNLLYSKSPQEFTWCVEPSNSISLEASNTTPGTEENISIDFSSNDGGYTTLQIQNPDTAWHSPDGWNWNTTEAGTIDIDYTHYEYYACQEVLFRMEHNICGSIFYSNQLSIIPNDALVSPFEEHYEFLTDKGYSDSEVNINWSVQDEPDDYAFSLERRVYEPSNGNEDNWTSIASNVTKSSSFVDQSATSNKLYEYRIKADRTCDTEGDEETVGISFKSDNQIGYRRGIGAVSGTITYGSGSGTAVEGVNVLATRLEGESLRQALNLNNQCLNVDLTKNNGESNLVDLLSSTEEEMAFGFWFKVTETYEQQDSSNVAPLFAIIDSTTANDAGYSQIYALKAVENAGSSSSFTIYQSTGAADDPISYSVLNMNTWYHLAAHRSGETLTYYIDGQQHFSKNYALVTSDTPLALIWGAGVSLTQGCIDPHAEGYTTDFTNAGSASPYYDVSLPNNCSYDSSTDNLLADNQCFSDSAFGEAYILRWYTDDTDALPIISPAANNTFTPVINTPTTLEQYTIYDFSFTAPSGSYTISSTDAEWSGAMKLIKSSGEVIIPWINYDPEPDSQNEYEFSVGDASIDEFSCDDNTTPSPWSGEHLHDALPNTDPNFGSPLSAQLTGSLSCEIPFAPDTAWTVTTWFKLGEPLSGESISIMSCKGHVLSAKNGFLHIDTDNTYIPISSSIWHFISLSSDGELRVYNTATDIHSENGDPDARPHVISSISTNHNDSPVIFFTDINTTLQSCFGWNRVLSETEITSVYEGVDANEFDGSENEINTDINFANGLVFSVGASIRGIQNRIDGTTLLNNEEVTLLQRGHSQNWIGGCYNDPEACNYNPLADAWGKCYYNCNPSIPSTSTTFDAGGIQLDEIQIWSDSASVHLYRTKYPSYNTPGLVAYWECDESAGVHAYDRSLTTPNGDDNQGSGRGDFNGLDGDILSVVCDNVTLYSESFDAFPNGYGFGQGGVPNGYGPENQEWTLTTSPNSLNYASVVDDGQGNHVFSTQTKTALVTWESPTISIKGYDNLTFSVDLSEDGPHESEDYIQVYARYNDSNSATLLGEQTGNFNSFGLTYNLDLDGNESVQFLIKMYNTGDDEILTFDNLILSTCPDSETEEGQLGNFQTADGANSTSFFTENIATAINLQGTSDSSGVYSIRNIKYQGSGDLFAFSPSFGIHTFEPTSRSALIGDALSTINNIDFVDISYFDYDITVLYQEIDSVSQTYPEEASGQGQTECGVPGVSFYIDGIIATSDEGIIETDAQGKATIQIGVGQHTLTASKANNTFKEESKNVFSINNSEENFICTTTRKATGRILGGYTEAALEWNASYGNMGIAYLEVVPAEWQHQTQHIDEDVHNKCPSVKITTDSLGQYEVDLLPLNYHTETNPTFPDYQGEISGELGYIDSPGAWDMEDADVTYADGNVFDNSPYGGSNDCPNCVDPSSHLRVDVLYIKYPEAMAYQGVYDAESATCTATPLLIDYEGEIIYSFIGEDTATFSLYLDQIPVALDSAYIDFYNTNKYESHTGRYTTGAPQPYPFGKPVLYPMTPYCLAIEQQEIYQNAERTSRYSSAVEADNVNIELDNQLNLLGYTTGPAFHDPSTETLIALLMCNNPNYGEYAQEANDLPSTSFGLQVNTGGSWSTWQPQPEVAALIKHYEDQFNENDNYDWSIAADIGVWGDVSDELFEAQIFGTAYAGDDMPISTNPELMFILRDPPGDASSTTLEQGSTVAQEISYESSNGLDTEISNTWSWGAKAESSTCVGIAIMSCTLTAGSDASSGFSLTENWSQESTENNTKSSEFSFEESISTSGDDDNGDLGYNQDLYYGTTENVTISNTGIFMYMDAGSQTHISDIGNTSDTQGSLYAIDLVANVDNSQYSGPNQSIVKAFEAAGHDATIAQSLTPTWAESVNISKTIDSYFMKTQFTLETIDLPALESVREDKFQTALSQEHITLGTYFDNEAVWKAHCGCEDESEHPMYGTNNDDPRWYWYYEETPSSVSWRDFDSGLDKSGPSYIVLDTLGDYGDDDTQDPIWEANINLISWKLMLAQNELDKLNARTNLNVSDFQNASLADDIADNYQDLTDQGVVYGDLENIYQFLGYADDNSGQDDNYTDRLWSWSDWQDFSISASGGGAEYSQTLTSTTTKTKARSASASSSSSLTGFNNWTVESFTKSEFESQASIGYTAVYTSEASASKETSLSYSYSISDDDAKDFFLVYVTPGEGMDSPIFLTLGGAASCPRVIEETSVYAEYYRMLSPQESFDYSDGSNGRMGRNEDGDCIAESTSYNLTYTRDDGSESVPIPFLTQDAADEWAVFLNLEESEYEVNIETTIIEGFKILKDLCDQLEDEQNTEFAIQPELLLIDSVDLSISAVGTPAVLVSDVPADEALVVDLILQNRSPINAVNDYVVYVDPTSNSDGHSIEFSSGGSTASFLQVGHFEDEGNIEFTATITSNGTTGQEANDIIFIAQSQCDDDVVDDVVLTHEFAPACTEMTLDTPTENWYAFGVSTEEFYTVSSSSLAGTDGMSIEFEIKSPNLRNYVNVDVNSIEDYGSGLIPHDSYVINSTEDDDAESEGHAAVFLEYRLEGELNWTPLEGWTADYIETVLSTSAGATQILSLDENNKLETETRGKETAVELRLHTFCNNDILLDTYSETVSGTIDRIAPSLFGRPLPLDHVLQEDDEIKFRFTEPINQTQFSPDDIKISGTLNTDPQANSGGLAFTGEEHLTLLDAPSLVNRDWLMSMNFYLDLDTTATLPSGTLFSQSVNGITIEASMNSGNLTLSAREEGATPTETTFESADSLLHGLWNELLVEGRRDADNTTIDVTINSSYLMSLNITIPEFNGSCNLRFGNSEEGDQPFSAVIQDIRLWNPQTEATDGYDDVARYTGVVTGKETGLTAWLPLNELEGNPVEQSRGKAVTNTGQWTIPTIESKALALNGDSTVMITLNDWTPIYDATLSCWFNKTATGAMTLLSLNDPESADDVNSEHWEVGFDADGKPYFANNGIAMTAPSAISEGWHHMALARERYGSTRLLIDGQEVVAGPSENFGRLIPGNLLLLGASIDSVDATSNPTQYHCSSPFIGFVDEVRFWTAALDDNAILSMMHDEVSQQATLGWLADFETTFDLDDTSDGIALTHVLTENLSAQDSIPLQVLSLDIDDPSTLNDLSAESALVQSDHVALIQSTSTTGELNIDELCDVSWNMDGDELIIDLHEELYYEMEDQELSFSIDQSCELEDILGNSAADIHWTLTVDLFPLAWEHTEIEAESTLGEDLMWTTTLFNTGSSTESFEITDGPAWLDISPASGTLGPNSSQVVTFTVAEPPFIGSSSCDVRVIGDFCDPSSQETAWCYGERLTLNYKVTAEVPELNFDPTGFENVMSVTAKVYLENHAAYDEEDIICAYIDNELRGIAPCDHWISNQALAFLSVFYSESDASKTMDFKIWDASRGIMVSSPMTYWPDIQGGATEVLVRDEGWGTVFEPLILQMGRVVDVPVDLVAGWNWISLPFNHPDHTASEGWTEWQVDDVFGDLRDNVIQAKSAQQDWAVETYDASNDWGVHQDTPLALNFTYQVKLAEDASVVWTGRIPESIDSTAYPVYKGWNDVGFPSQRILSIEDVMYRLYDSDVLELNDHIKGRYDGFATYIGNGEWAGTLSHLEPTRGYRMYLQGMEEMEDGDTLGTLVLPQASLFLGNPSLLNLESDFETPQTMLANVETMEHSMVSIATLALPTHWIRSPLDRIEWWAEGRMIGYGRPALDDDGERYYVYGFGEHTGFKTDIEILYVSGTTGQTHRSIDKVSFEANGQLGTFKDPVMWRFHEEEVESTAALLNVIPNPFSASFELLYSGDTPLKRLTLIDTRGRIISERRGIEGVKRYEWNTANLENGMYFIQVIDTMGEIQRVPLIKQ